MLWLKGKSEQSEEQETRKVIKKIGKNVTRAPSLHPTQPTSLSKTVCLCIDSTITFQLFHQCAVVLVLVPCSEAVFSPLQV